MEVIALIGSSGTGKSHRALLLAHQQEAQALIDDGLLIQENRILAGSSAKRQPTRIGAIKAALFTDEKQAQEVRTALEHLSPEKVLILGTSLKMVERITARLGLPAPQKTFTIEDVASEKEIRKAKYMRTSFSKHVIPVPTLEVKRSFPGTLADPLQVFLRRKNPAGKKDWLEQSVVRPTYTYNGRLTIANSALVAIAAHAAATVDGVKNAGRLTVNPLYEGSITIEVTPIITYGSILPEVARKIQQQVKTSVEEMTGLLVKEVNVQVKGLSL